LLQLLGELAADCAIHHKRKVREELHPYICGANKK